jgi:hypothetical protein
LEKQETDHEKRIADLEESLKSLTNSLTGSGGDDTAVPHDGSKLGIRVSLLADELKKKADKTELEHQSKIH